jgi:energy-coupling factor transport system ATP-binding protein
VITFDHVSVTYPGAGRAVLHEVDLEIEEGTLCVVVGPTGSGKSTLLSAVNGLVPHFTGGRLDGKVVVAGRETRLHPPRELADVVGHVGQDPLAGFVTDRVEEELAYVMEHLAVPPATMRKRVEETLDLLGIADLRDRPMRTLSGGQQQRVAIGAALTAHPQVLVLDEPTSALDPTAAEEVLSAITRLVHDLGLTVVLAEHRLERVIGFADQLVHVGGDGSVVAGTPAAILAGMDRVPPVIELGRVAGWEPPPLSVRDARRRAPELRARLRGLESSLPAAPVDPREAETRAAETSASETRASATRASATAPPLAARGISVRYGDVAAVRSVDLELDPGTITALMGRNGSGKSSLLWALQGSGKRHAGRVAVDGHDPAGLDAAEARRLVGLVPQSPSDLLYLDSVEAECRQADRESAVEPGTCRRLLDRLVVGIDPASHPRDLSEGQRLALVLAIQLSAGPSVLLLDEPTRGLDYVAKTRLAVILRDLAAGGRPILLSTHDVEFVATVASRVIVMAQGEVIADGTATEILTASPAFAPQVSRILAPDPWLSVAEVATVLARDVPRAPGAEAVP